MATIPPITLKAMYDGTEVVTGAAESQAAIKALGDTATTELGTTVPAAVDQSAVTLTTKASKFKAVGTELGTELAAGVAGGVDPATSAVNVGSSLSGLLAASASTAKGAAAAVGLGIGVALIKSMIDAAEAEAQALRDAVQNLLGGVEGDFKGSLKNIINEMRAELDKVAVITELGEGDLGAGWTRLEQISHGTGENMQTLVDVLQGKANPAAQQLREEFAKGEVLSKSVADNQGDQYDALAIQYTIAKDLVELSEKNTKAWDEAKAAAAGLNELMNTTRHSTAAAADEAERFATNLANANTAAGNIGNQDTFQ